MPRTVLMPADSPQLSAAGVRVLQSYVNGTVLAEVPAGADLSGDPGPPSGLRLPATQAEIGAAQRIVKAAANRPAPENEPSVAAYVEFVGPPDPRWLAAVQERGIAVLAYQPENSYLVRGRRSDLARLAAAVRTTEGQSAVLSVTELTEALKTRPEAIAEAGEPMAVVLAATREERSRTIAALQAVDGIRLLSGAGNDVLDAQRIRVRVRAGELGVAALLGLPQVLSVETFAPATPEDELAGLIVAGELDAAAHPSGSYDRWLTDHHIDGSGAVIGIVDGGVDVAHPAFAGRIRDLAGGQKDWHATMVAGHAAGAYRTEQDSAGFAYGLGTAPRAILLSQDRSRPAGELCAATVTEAGAAVAIQNNSWGRGARDPMDYGSEEALYDALVRNARGDGGGAAAPLTVCFSAGNSGAAGLTRPKGAKNAIVTGNSESYRPDIGAADSDDVREVYTGFSPSSKGNCGDGRIRPHVVAPGEWTASANSGIRPGEVEYVSPMIAWGGGSSGASPKTAGACALLAQWWRRWHGGTDPSPAMLRALVVNGAVPISTGGPVPNTFQGWGRLSLRELLDHDVARIAFDQGDWLTGPGATRTWQVRVVDSSRPVKITLAWTDPPGAIGSGTATSSTIVNRLALRAQDGTRIWRGGADRFRLGWTQDDATLAAIHGLREEGADNLQCVFLPAGQARRLTVSVTALTVTTDALTGRFDRPQQDFALVVTNAEIDAAAGPTMVAAGIVSGPATGTAWWAADAATPPGPGAVEAELQVAARTLAAAGGQVVTVTPSPGLAGLAAAVGERLRGPSSAVVLGVPAGTAVTADDVDAVRGLAGRTGVHLVSDDPALLSGLAAQVGPHRGVQYRLADRPDALAGLLRDTALTAGGMQELDLGPSAATGFGIVPSDGVLVVGLPAGARTVRVRRPSGETVLRVRATDDDSDAASSGPQGLRAVDHGDRIDVIVEDAGQDPGDWTMHIDAGPGAPAPAAWVRGGIDLDLTAAETRPGARLLRIAAGPGGLLRQVAMPRSRVDPVAGPAPESDRPLVLRVPRRRRPGGDEPQGDAEAEAERAAAVPAFGHVIDVAADATTVLDVPLDVVSTWSGGIVTARRVRAGIVTVPPASARRYNLPDRPNDGTTQLNGRIVELTYDHRRVIGVRVTEGRRVHELVVADEGLGATLAAMDRTQIVRLGVRGAELQWVFVAFCDVPSADRPSPREQ